MRVLFGSTGPDTVPVMRAPTRLPHCAAALCGLFSMVPIFGPNPSSAAPGQVSVRPQTGDLLELTVCSTSATFEFDISTGSSTLIELPRGFQSFSHVPDTPYGIERDGNKLYLVPPPDMPENDQFSLRIFATDATGKQAFETTLHTRTVKKVLGVRDNVVIYHQSDKNRFGKRPEDNPCLLRELSPRQLLRLRAFGRHNKTNRTIGIPEIEQVARTGNGLKVEPSLYEWEAGNLVLDVTAMNPQSMRIDDTEIRVFDRHGKRITSEVWRWDASGHLIQEPDLTVDGYHVENISLHIPNANQHEIEPMRIEFRGVKGSTPFMTSLQVGTFRPMTPEEVEKQRLEQERQRLERERLAREREQREKAKGIMLGLRALGGAMWLGDGADLGMVGGAMTSGLGVRVTKGISPLWAFEAEIVGGATGSVRFDDVMWEATSGDIRRDAQFGRFLLGGQLRFGDRYRPHARFGVGSQVVRHQAHFAPDGGNEREGPDSGFALDLLWSVGAGMTLRFKEHWTAGIEISNVGVIQSLSSDTLRGGFEGGLYVSYGWSP